MESKENEKKLVANIIGQTNTGDYISRVGVKRPINVVWQPVSKSDKNGYLLGGDQIRACGLEDRDGVIVLARGITDELAGVKKTS